MIPGTHQHTAYKPASVQFIVMWHDCQSTATGSVQARQRTAYSQSAAAGSIQQHDHLHTPAYSIHARVQRTVSLQQSALAYNDVIASVQRHDEMRLPKSSNRWHTTTWPAVHASVQRTYQPACKPASVQRYDATWRDAVQLPKLSRWQHTTWLPDMPVCSLLNSTSLTWIQINKMLSTSSLPWSFNYFC